MAATGTGAVFFLGTRAHYQVLQQPEARFDAENGNPSTETIYQNPTTDLWNKENQVDNYINGGGFCNGSVPEDNDGPVKRRIKRGSSETEPSEDMTMSLNNDNVTPKRRSRISFLAFLSSLSLRKKKLDDPQPEFDESFFCTMRGSCRCIDCQSRYFECDEEDEDYNSEDDTEYLYYVKTRPCCGAGSDEDDDEEFTDQKSGDDTSTNLLIDCDTEEKVSVSSSPAPLNSNEEPLSMGMVAGAPVLLNYLLTHPITCVLQ